MASKLLFESKVCSRCQGSGHYSFNLRYGTVCFGCQGSGEQLTKRGNAAQNYFRELCTVLVSELVVGDVIRGTHFTEGGDQYETKVEIISINPNGGIVKSVRNGVPTEHQHTELVFKSKHGESGLHTFPNHKVEVFGRDRKAKIQQALAYQETLTQLGKPAKRKKTSQQQ